MSARDAVALGMLARNPRITVLDLAGELVMTERALRKPIAGLYEAGHIRRNREDRRVRYSINPRKPLRRELYDKVPVSGLLETLDWRPQKGRHIE